MINNIKYCQYSPSQVDQVVELLNLCFPEKNITNKTFNWKHFHSYFGGKSQAAVGIDKQLVCAFVCFTPVKIATNNLHSQFYSCAIQATHPEYRRMGIVSKLTQMIEKKLGPQCHYLGFSNSQGVLIDKYSRKIGYHILGELCSRHVLSLPYTSAVQIKSISYHPQTTNISSSSFTLSKNYDYLSWRYYHHPKIRYEYFELIQSSQIIGYLIGTKHHLRYKIHDLILYKQSPAQTVSVIKVFANYAFMHGAIFFSYIYLPNDFWARSFPFASFAKKIGIHFTVKSRVNKFIEKNNWLIQGGDIQ